jgi:hypothetical protein
MITPEMAMESCGRLAALRFFPSEPGARAEIAGLLMRIVVKPEQLEWLVRTMIDQVGEWKGTRELRAVFCTRFKPADGIEEWSQISGFTAIDSENSFYLEDSARKKLAGESPRTNALRRADTKMLTAGANTVIPMPVPPRVQPVDRLTRETREMKARERLAAVTNAPTKPISIPATPKRTPEENARLVEELAEQLRQRQQRAPGDRGAA